MKFWQYNTFGDTSVLTLQNGEVPKAKTGEILVKVEAISINPIDWKLMSGKMRFLISNKMPVVPCFDVAGVVEDANNVTEFKKGERVYARLQSTAGTASAEYIAHDASVFAKIPEGMSFAEAAAVPLAGLTALQGLRDLAGFDVKGNTKRVLVVGASGGVGHFAVQVAVAAGAHVTAVCGTTNVDFVKSLGAHEVIDYKKQSSFKSADGQPYDIIYDAIGGMSLSFNDILKADGTYVTPAPGIATMLRSLMFWKSRKVKTFFMKPSRADIDYFSQLYRNKKLRVAIDSNFNFEDLPKAFKRNISGRAVGKVVVTLSQS